MPKLVKCGAFAKRCAAQQPSTVHVNWYLSGNAICSFQLGSRISDEDVMKKIARSSGVPMLAQRLFITGENGEAQRLYITGENGEAPDDDHDSYTFDFADSLEDFSRGKDLMKNLRMLRERGSAPKILLQQRDLRDVVDEFYGSRQGLLIDKAFQLGIGEARRLVQAGYMGIALDYLEREFFDDESDYSDRSGVFRAVEHILHHGENSWTGQNPFAEAFRNAGGVDRLPQAVDISPGDNDLMRRILNNFFGAKIPPPERDLTFVSIENGGHWNPGRYGIMPDECE